MTDKEFNQFTERLPEPIVRAVAEARRPHKLKLKVIEDVLEASNAWGRLRRFEFGREQKHIQTFNYDGDGWTSTIKAHSAGYENVPLGIPDDTYFSRFPMTGMSARSKTKTNKVNPLLFPFFFPIV